MQEMIEKGIQEGVYVKTGGNTLQDLKRFQDFFYRNFSKYEQYNDVLPSSNHPVQLYGTAKAHKFDDINDITVDSFKFRSIVSQTGTYMYKTVQVISEYLKPLYENNGFIIRNTEDFAQLIREQPPLEENEKYVSHDAELLFTNTPIHDTIKYILEEIFTHNKLPHICSKFIFKKLLLKLATESTYIFQSQFYKQTDGCRTGGPLSVTFSNIYLTKLEKYQVKPLKLKFYCRFVDDVISRRLKNMHDSLFEN